MNERIGYTADAGETVRKSTVRCVRRTGRRARLLTVVIGLVSLAAFAAYTLPATGHPQNEGSCGCHPTGPDSLLSVAGIPTAYVPGATYTVAISVNDLNGANGQNAFSMDITGGGTMNASMQTDPNVEINTDDQRASTNDALPKQVASWNVVWKAPLSGDVTFTVSAVSSNDVDKGSNSPTDTDTVTISPAAIPEFQALLVPLIAVVGTLITMKLAVRR